jgi:hypothetical protein
MGDKIVDDFLALRTWANFKNGIEDLDAFHLLCCGILGKLPERRPLKEDCNSASLSAVTEKLKAIKNWFEEGLIRDDVLVAAQTQIIDYFIRGEGQG